MSPQQAYKLLNKTFWANRLPEATITMVDNNTIPRLHGITLFDEGYNLFEKPVIILNRDDVFWGKTLVHEMLHVAEPAFPHGKLFESIVTYYWRKAKPLIGAER
jgi:hypothetical protein